MPQQMCEKIWTLPGIAIYERYFSQVKSHTIFLFRKDVVDHVLVHWLKMAAYVKQN